ncbi:unnamed protein product [Ceratitis capitata]|uniref:(Mediterranean fruit fly) hypothetical protein n=1 Tax=Ceratitis capitata TaxID=7213 RepID=A0A811TXV8_CERCA|nr:unnamed protein product [Ceratitis capitata]
MLTRMYVCVYVCVYVCACTCMLVLSENLYYITHFECTYVCMYLNTLVGVTKFEHAHENATAERQRIEIEKALVKILKQKHKKLNECGKQNKKETKAAGKDE